MTRCYPRSSRVGFCRDVAPAWIGVGLAVLFLGPLLLRATVGPPLPTFFWSVPGLTVPESSGRAVFTINLQPPPTTTASISWVVAGTALPGVDFTGPLEGVSSFAPGQTNAVIEFTLLNDGMAGETNETIVVVLANAVGGIISGSNSVSVTIVDDSAPLGPELMLSKSASPSTVSAGDAVTFLISVANTGTLPAVSVQVQDVLSSGFLFLSALDGGAPAAYDPGLGVWSVGSLSPGAVRTLTLNVQAPVAGVWTNGALIVQPTNLAPSSIVGSAAFVNVLAPDKADLVLTKIADPGSAGVEQPITFVIRVGNLGPNDSKDIVVKDTLPGGVVLKSFTAADGTTFDDTKKEWKIPNLAVGNYVDLELVTTANAALRATNVAAITASGVADPDATNNRAEAAGEWLLYRACGTVRFCHWANGDPHTNALVELRKGGQKLADTRTDAQGTFCFSDLMPGAYQLVAHPADPSLGIQDSEPETIEFGDGKPGGQVQVTSPWPVVRGFIRYGSSGPAVPNIEVKLSGKDTTGKQVDLKVTTGNDGGYLFTNLTDGVYTVTPTPTAVGSFWPARAQIKQVWCVVTTNFNYGSDKEISGRTVTCDLPPAAVPYATVKLSHPDFPNLRVVTEGPGGVFRFNGLTDGTYTLTAEHPTYDFAPVVVKVQGGFAYKRDLVGTPKKGLLYVRIKDNKGAPVSGVEVAIAPKGAAPPTATLTTDATGTALFANLANGIWFVQPQSDRKITYTPASDLVGIGQAQVCRNSTVFTASANAVELVALEVVQVVQNWRNSMPLVEGKRTLVRAFLKPAGSSTNAVTVKGLQLKIEPTGGRATTLNGKEVVARADYAKVRNDPAASLAFDLTPFAKGEVKLTLLWPTGFLTPTPAATAAGALTDTSTTVQFVPAPPLEIKTVLLDWKFKAKSDAATAARIPEHHKRLLAALPITSVPAAQTTYAWRPPYDPTTADINDNTLALYDEIQSKRLRDGVRAGKTIYYTLVPGEIVRDNGIHGGDIVLIRANLTTPQDFYRNRPPHEIGHTLGRHHAVHSGYGIGFGAGGPVKRGACDEIADPVAPDFPMDFFQNQPLQPTLGPMLLGDYRLGFGWDSSDGTYISPLGTADLMSYCTFRTAWSWPGLYTYPNLFNALVNRFGRGGAPAPKSDAAGQPCVVLSGSVDSDLNLVTLNPVWETLVPTDPIMPEPGGFTLRLYNLSGLEIFEAPFALDSILEADPVPVVQTRAPFRFCLPLTEPIGAIEVSQGTQLLLRQERSAHPPQIQITAPAPGSFVASPELLLQWQASDPDGDALTYLVDVSPDGGVTWTTVAQNLTDSQLLAPVSSLPGNTGIVFRVTASDAFWSAAAAVNVTLADHAPIVAILSPTAGMVVADGFPVDFTALAQDPEDGPLPDASIMWISDRDGVLGLGTALSVDPSLLSAGTNTVTVTGQDQAGHQVSDSIALIVRHDPGPVLEVVVEEAGLRLSWPSAYDLWTVEATLDLNYPDWFSVDGDLDASGDPVVLRIPTPDSRLFFRLSSP